MGLERFCRTQVQVIDAAATVEDAAAMMKANHVGFVVVLEKAGMEEEGVPRPIGILTDRDIVLRIVAEGIAAKSVVVADVMTMPLHMIRQEQNAYEALITMKIHGVSRLPVVGTGGALAGMVELTALLKATAAELACATDIAQSQLNREKSQTPIDSFDQYEKAG